MTITKSLSCGVWMDGWMDGYPSYTYRPGDPMGMKMKE